MYRYQCYKVYNFNKRAEHIAHTVEFCPENTTTQGIPSAYEATHTATDLISSMKNPVPAAPFALQGTENFYALKKLTDIFQSKITGKASLIQLKHRQKTKKKRSK